MRRKLLLGILSLSAVLAVWTFAQRAPDRPVGYEAEPGGTAEADLWQVLVLMGVGDSQPVNWSGRATASAGSIHAIDGYRFELPDRLLPEGSWRLDTRRERVNYSYELGSRRQAEQLLLPKGVLIRGSGAARLSVETPHGNCALEPTTIAFFHPQKCLGGRVEIHRLPPATDLSGTELRQHDFPSIAASPNGTLWTTWLSYHDRREELNFRRHQDGRWTRLIPVARAAEDLWRPQAVTDETGRPWIIWSQQKLGNWDIYAMPWDDNEWGPVERLSQGVLPDFDATVARGADGTIYVVWQALEGKYSQVHMRYRRGGRWSEILRITEGAANNWEPAIAVGKDGTAWIAWDRYNESYDVYVRRYRAGEGFGPEMKVAASRRMEAYATVAVDARNRPWIAWETGGVNWGKDVGPLGPRQPGSPLGDRRFVEVAVLDQGEWKSPGEFKAGGALEPGSSSTSRPLLHATSDGALWMTFKRRYSRLARNTTHWESFLTRLEGTGWSEPVLLPYSLARKSTRMGMAEAEGRLWLNWPGESRRYEFGSRPRLNRVIVGSVPLGNAPAEPTLSAYRAAPEDAPAGHADEAGDVAGIRAHRVRIGGQEHRIVRGDLHRHTELSQDQGGMNDGSLPEFYRYMIDAAAMDFGASTDHQAGGTDYWNFMALKMADMFHFPERFVPLYAYERNIAFPHGHRNIVHTQRNYPIVPFFQRMDPKFLLPDAPDGELLTFNGASYGGAIENDTKLLYEELRKSNGIAIPHTSGSSGMGTDWRDNDRDLEPVVEIYQGDRHNYEHKNAPRGVKDGEEQRAIGGFQEAGMVWNAWKKGYRLGVIASSDHFSTHMSYAMVYTPGQERQAIFNSIRRRQAYGATDNIILEFWMGNHFMGDDYRARRAEKIRIRVRGTGPIAKVHLIRDAAYVHAFEPGTRDVALEFVDKEVKRGEHWYYVRVEQADGELAWSSPIWVRLE